MNLNGWQNSGSRRQRTEGAMIGAYSSLAEAIGFMISEGRSLRFAGIEHLEQALKHITLAEKELFEMRALEEGDER